MKEQSLFSTSEVAHSTSLENLLDIEIQRYEGTEDARFDAFLSPLTVRALNLDNRVDSVPLGEFLELCRSGEKPNRFVAELPFLRGEYEEFEEVDKILSLVVAAEDEILAHAALRFDSNRCAETIYAAVHPAHRNHSFRFARLLFRKMQSLAQEQGWKTLYQFNPASESCLQIIATRCFDSHETAIIPVPPHFGTDERSNDVHHVSNRSILVMVHHFAESEPAPRSIYLPKAHATKIRELFDGLALDRVPSEKSRRAKHDGDVRKQFPVARILRATSGIDDVTVHPSAIQESDEVLKYLEDCVTRVTQDKTRLMVRVALNDAAAPAFCEELEKKGFRFCGILPEILDQDWIVYSHYEPTDVAGMNLYTSRAHELRDYLAGL